MEISIDIIIVLFTRVVRMNDVQKKKKIWQKITKVGEGKQQTTNKRKWNWLVSDSVVVVVVTTGDHPINKYMSFKKKKKDAYRVHSRYYLQKSRHNKSNKTISSMRLEANKTHIIQIRNAETHICPSSAGITNCNAIGGVCCSTNDRSDYSWTEIAR